jgi:uncharacterized integral membrane protein
VRERSERWLGSAMMIYLEDTLKSLVILLRCGVCAMLVVYVMTHLQRARERETMARKRKRAKSMSNVTIGRQILTTIFLAFTQQTSESVEMRKMSAHSRTRANTAIFKDFVKFKGR